MMILIWLLAGLCRAQVTNSEPKVVESSFEFRLDITKAFAPGQPAVLLVYGAQVEQGLQVAEGPEFPTELAGFSVDMSPYGSLPILQVARICPRGSGLGCGIAAITVQIPYEIQPRGSPLTGFATETMVIRRNGDSISLPISILPYPVNVHLLNRGELLTERLKSDLAPATVAQHDDGTWVTPEKPAKPGEALVMWAVGLRMSPASGTPVTGRYPGPGFFGTVDVQHDFGVNFPPQRLILAESVSTLDVDLEPNRLGVFKVVIRVPPIPSGVRACGGPILSNYTVTIGYRMSNAIAGGVEFDGAQLCVDVRNN